MIFSLIFINSLLINDPTKHIATTVLHMPSIQEMYGTKSSQNQSFWCFSLFI